MDENNLSSLCLNFPPILVRNAFEVVQIGSGMYTNLPSIEVVG